MTSPNTISSDEREFSSSMQLPGVRLRERRELQRLSLESVAMQLHTSVQVVRALEENDLGKLPPPVYVRGFLRSYARLLELPESEVLGADSGGVATAPRVIRSEAGELESLNLAARSRPVLSGFLTLGVVAALGLIAWQLVGDKMSEPSVADGPPAVTSTAAEGEHHSPAALALPAELPAAAEKSPASSPVRDELASVSASVPKPTAPEPSAPALPSTAQQGPQATVPAPESPVPNALVITFKGESWVTVIDALGQRLLYEAGVPGTSKTVAGKPPLKITLGRPGNVSLEFNGQPYVTNFSEKSGPARLKIGG
jgi:cytoskeleton protein RodZ